MRTEHTWFQERLARLWKARPGRSCLLVVPPGCAAQDVVDAVLSWLGGRDPAETAGANRRVAVARITVDAVTSSGHFARRLRRELGRSSEAVGQVPDDAYAADWVECLVAAAQSDGVHPVLVIDRFHAFAAIADDHLLSLLSTLRQLEHDGQLTTIAVSAMSYRTIREELSARGAFPFVNSAYGDNHDQVTMPPLTRAEFVAAAVAAGLAMGRAQALFALAGGPDTVSAAIIKAALEGEEGVVDRASRALGGSLERFFDLAIGPLSSDRDDLRLRVATGQLQPAQLAHLRHLELSAFLLGVEKDGRATVASPVLGRLLLTGRTGPWTAYAKVMDATDDRRFGDAARQATLLEGDAPHLQAFKGLVTMLAALHDSDSGGLLEIDWNTVRRTGRHLLASDLPIAVHLDWIAQLVRWGERVGDAVENGHGPGARLDVLARQAADPDVRRLLEYALRTYLGRVKRRGSPGEQVRAAGSVPESVLQALAAYFGFDPLNFPDGLPGLDYQRFFNGQGRYREPQPGNRLDLTHLLVLVPAIAEARCAEFRDELQLCDPNFVRPLHQRLVARMRNATAHTYAEMDASVAEFFFKTCHVLLDDAVAIWNREAPVDLPREPDRQALANLLSGRVAVDR